MAAKTIIYYTDSCLWEPLATQCRELLRVAAGGTRLISVSQKPLDFGENICVGEIGRSHLSLYRQVLLGCEATDADVVYMAEHDCLYTREHFAWDPPDRGTFYYNANTWFVNWMPRTKGRGRYSFPSLPARHATSQLVCNRELLMENLRDRIARIEAGWALRRGARDVCEPGVRDADDSGWVRMHHDGVKISKCWSAMWRAEIFHNILPNVDIRHGGNLTGWRRGESPTMNLYPWGDFAELMNG